MFMKIFVYAMREYDELKYFEEYKKSLVFEYSYTTEYPSLENAELAKGYDGINIITNHINKELLDKYKALGIKYIATRTIGYEHIDTKYAKSIGIKVCNVTYSPNSVANYTIMMMLMACRKMSYILNKANIQDFSLHGKIGKEISCCTIGIIGTGRIGSTVIKHLSSFGCKILAYDIYPKKEISDFATYTDLDTIYKNSHIISLHAPATCENYHMINKDAFNIMKDDVIIINAARGSLIDTKALIDALKNKKVGFAALDTIEYEKGLYYFNLEKEIISNDDRAILLSFPNVILSPHMAFYTEEAVSNMVGNSVKGLIKFENNEPNEFEVEY